MKSLEERVTQLEQRAERSWIAVVAIAALVVALAVLPSIVYVLQRFLFPGTPLILLMLAVLPGYALVVAGVVIAVRRYTRKPPPGFCQNCGYNLKGNVSGACPECGTDIDSSS
jgi:hypothetical protein